MARILLHRTTEQLAIFITADDPGNNGPLIARSITFPNSSPFTLRDPIAIPREFLAANGNDLQFAMGPQTGLAFTVGLMLTSQGEFRFFDALFDGTQDIAASVTLTIPAADAVPSPEAPFASFAVCGLLAIDNGTLFVTERFCFEVAIESLPADLSTAPLPGLRLRLPDIGFELPRLPIAWPTFPSIPLPPYRLPAISVALDPLPIVVSVQSIGILVERDGQTATKTTVDLRGIRIGGVVGAIEGDLHLVLRGTQVQAKDCFIRLYRPDADHALTLAVKAIHVSHGCFGIAWDEPQLMQWLALLAPDSSALPVSGVTGVALRVLYDGSIEEARLDWTLPQNKTVVPLPGFEVTLPPVAFYSLVGYRDAVDDRPRVLLAASIGPNQELAAHSTFTWSRGEDRELLKDPDDAKKDFVRFSTKTKATLANAEAPFPEFKLGNSDEVEDPEPEPDEDFDFGPAAAVSLAVFDLPLDGGEPRFFRQLNMPLDPLEPLVAPDPQDALPYDCDPTDTTAVTIRLDDWEPPQLVFNAGKKFRLPVLATADQGITLDAESKVTLGEDSSDSGVYSHEFSVPLSLTLKLGNFELSSELDARFNYERFAFRIDDSKGIPFVLKTQGKQNRFLGLEWRFRGPKGEDSGFTLFTLVTTGRNYQLRQQPGTTIELDFTAATSEGHPITFAVSDFVLGPRGVDLSATVTNRPAKLSGIDTEFTFRQGSFQIRNSRITDFSLTGSGPLPPALVGSATAEISLQFSQDASGQLRLISGTAKLEGKNLLKCQGTRFEFSVDGLGLKFVEQNGHYHLYFTVTGTARYTPLASDDASGPLAWLPKIEMRMMECPLTGDARVISQHVNFLVELPRKVGFNLLGCFQFELRGIGFVPQATMFDDLASAMRLSGQVKFSDGGGDVLDARIDLHDLFVGLPAPGSLIPRLHLKHLGVKLKTGDAFELDGYVDFLNDEPMDGLRVTGFRGGGTLVIKGLPKMAAAFSFVRVSDDEGQTWKRAWFIYVEAREVSFPIPVVELFIREVGLGFGYRYTLAMIKKAEEINDPKELIKTLKQLSRSQGELSSQDQWRIDVDNNGDDPRWTVVFRAMISQTSASHSLLDWNPIAERNLPCLFLFDVVVALRSDLTFLMTARAWLSTNYWEFDQDQPAGIRTAPLVSGFVLLSPRQKRFLAHVSSNPNAKFGQRPPLGFLKDVLASCHFSATFLLEPGLLHYELGWPNQLRWGAKIGPLEAEFRGGTIFRLSRTELVVGNSFEARGSLSLSAGVDLGLVGARLTALARVAYGARYIGVISFKDPFGQSAFYGVAGIDIRVDVSIEFWIRIPVLFGTITINFGFSFFIAITAAVQVGIAFGEGLPAGVRGTASVALGIMGHSLHFGICVGINDDVVRKAQGITSKFLNIGLEAADVEPIPGEQQLGAPEFAPLPSALTAGISAIAESPLGESDAAAAQAEPFLTPNYSVLFIPKEDGAGFPFHTFVLVPSADRVEKFPDRLGFLPVPPLNFDKVEHDFLWEAPDAQDLERFDPFTGKWVPLGDGSWKVNWDKTIGTFKSQDGTSEDVKPRNFLLYAYEVSKLDKPFGTVEPIADPQWLPSDVAQFEDARVYDPSEAAYEAAVRGAADQFESAKLKHDPTNSPYDSKLGAAYNVRNSVYGKDGVEIKDPKQDLPTENGRPAPLPNAGTEQAIHTRSIVIQTLIEDVQKFAANPNAKVVVDQKEKAEPLTEKSLAFQCGLVFRVKESVETPPEWLLDSGDGGTIHGGTIQQRSGREDHSVDEGQKRGVRVFNTAKTRFDVRAPHFERVKQYADATSISITWDLEWPADKKLTGLGQNDPLHHLKHYLVRRRPLDGADRGIEYAVRPADVLHREDNAHLFRLRPRFQVVDHFTDETAQDLADLPEQGRTYLYTITPIDISGHASPRPLTVVATRRASEPPPVPTDIELTIEYDVPAAAVTVSNAAVQAPKRAVITWTPPPVKPDVPRVTPKQYTLVFRRESAEPIGSYGLDAVARGSRADGLPTSNARKLRTDLEVELPFEPSLLKDDDPAKEDLLRQPRIVDLEALKASGVLSRGEWRPDAWRAYVQVRSNAGVDSALTPVQIVLRFGVAAKPTVFEVKRPGHLEFIAQPTAFPFVRPEDEEARVGPTLVPMPSSDPREKVITFRPHPDGSRAVRFHWNQGSTKADALPPDLQAGYTLYEYDLDAHTAGPIDQADPGDNFRNRLRPIQEVELLPASDAGLTPSDTLSASKWEAWYPATVRRSQIAQARQLKTPLSPWFSWRESLVVWPPEDFDPPLAEHQPPSERAALFDAAGVRRADYHRLIGRLLDDLASMERLEPPPRFGLDKLPLFVVDVAAQPSASPMALEDFLAQSSPEADPYGWQTLQRAGLSACFCLRDRKTGTPQPAHFTIGLIETLLKGYNIPKDIAPHLHVEHLIQPGRSIRIEATPLQTADHLNIVQVSLRPAARPLYQYAAYRFRAEPPGDLQLTVTLDKGAACTILDSVGPTRSEKPFTQSGTLRVTIPPDGNVQVLVRASDLKNDTIAVANHVPVAFLFLPDDTRVTRLYEVEAKAGATVTFHVELRNGKSCRRLNPQVVTDPGVELTSSGNVVVTATGDGKARLLLKADRNDDVSVALVSREPFALTSVDLPTSGLTSFFTVDMSSWATAFTDHPKDSEEPRVGPDPRKDWSLFRKYLHGLNSTDPAQPRIALPDTADGAGIVRVLNEVLPWMQRFHDHALDLKETVTGPTIATAYPRMASPVAAVPDDAGRVEYYHVVTDPWGHTFRYYIQPSGRYDQLWQSLRQSTLLFGQTAPAVPAIAVPSEPGGLDVVLSRTKEVAPPLILSSSRIDPKNNVASPVPPGPIWEVVLAKHPEQMLIERNQTLFRQLEYRQVAVTLMRRFGFADALTEFQSNGVAGPIDIAPIVFDPKTPLLPGAYPPPDTLDLGDEQDIRAIDLPERVGDFSHGVVAYQWRGLPYFYEQRFVATAQTASVASVPVEVVHRDFEFVSPSPIARTDAIDGAPPPSGKPWPESHRVRRRLVQIDLASYWDCLPEQAQNEWPLEDPTHDRGKARKHSSLPDVKVIYQVLCGIL